MLRDIDLGKLSPAEKDALILLLGERLEAALARIAVLEQRLEELTRPPKTPGNSSLPPSSADKPNRPPPGRGRRLGRPGKARALHPDPDRTIAAHLDACPHCQAGFAHQAQSLQHEYDRIELPPVRPDVTRVHLFGGACACCGKRATATAPAGLEPGSPFGRSVEAMVVYLHYTHAIGLERLRAVMAEVFGLPISEGALCNILARARAPLLAATLPITEAVRQAPVVCCDETSTRVGGKTWWEWAFVTKGAVLHLIRPSRGKAVPREVFGQTRPGVWVSDALPSQRGHGEEWQMCLAHLLRDTLKDNTLAYYRADLDRRLSKIMQTVPKDLAGEKLRARIGRDRSHLFVFVTNRDVPPTNNVSEHALRPSVIFRKVTNGFRAEWGAEVYAAFRSVVSTAKLTGQATLDALRNSLGQCLAPG